MRKLLPLFLVVLSLSQLACNSASPRSDDAIAAGPVEQPMSRQTAGSETRQRAKVHAELGRLYMLDGRYDVALEEAGLALEIDSSYAPAHSLKAAIHMALRKSSEANASFQTALSIAPNDPEINNDYGWFLCQSAKYKESIPYFKVAIGNPLYQSVQKSLTNAGWCSVAAKEDKQAEEFMLRALRMDRNNITAMYWLADIAYRDTRYMEARRRINDLHGVIGDPTVATAWLGLRIERKLGDRENEARYTGLIRRKFRDSEEYLKLSRGEFD